MKFLGHDIKLVIFDLDGTLIDSTTVWADIDVAFFHKHNMDIPPKYSEEIAHIGLIKAAELTASKYIKNEKPEDILKEWTELCYEAYATKIPLKPHAEELLKVLKEAGVHIALATANSKEIYEVALARLKIRQYFDTVLDVNSCKEGKNSPEIYDKAKEFFKVKREETLVVEDMIRPLQTVYSAGYITVAIYDKHSTQDIKLAKDNSHLFIKDLGEIIPKIVL